MLSLFRQRDENRARHIIIDHLSQVHEAAKKIEQDDIKCHKSPHSIPYYLQEVNRSLDTKQLQKLLHTDNAGVAAWANRSPKVYILLGSHHLQLVPTVGEFEGGVPHLLAIAPQIAAEPQVA